MLIPESELQLRCRLVDAQEHYAALDHLLLAMLTEEQRELANLHVLSLRKVLFGTISTPARSEESELADEFARLRGKLDRAAELITGKAATDTIHPKLQIVRSK